MGNPDSITVPFCVCDDRNRTRRIYFFEATAEKDGQVETKITKCYECMQEMNIDEGIVRAVLDRFMISEIETTAKGNSYPVHKKREQDFGRIFNEKILKENIPYIYHHPGECKNTLFVPMGSTISVEIEDPRGGTIEPTAAAVIKGYVVPRIREPC